MIRRFKDRGVTLLRWSEKYTKTDMVYLASGGSLSIISQGIGLLAALLLAVVVSHFVPKEVYGQYKYILSVVGILSFFSFSGIGSAVMQSVARGFDGALHKGFWINLRWSALMFVAAGTLAIYYFWAGNAKLATGILIGGFLSPVLASANLYGAFLAGKKDFVRQITFATIENTIPVGIFIVVVLLTTNPVALVATYFVSNLLATLYFYRRTVEIYKPDPARVDGGMLLCGKHLSAMNILSGIAGNLDQILLFHYVGAAELAVYNFATAIPDQIKGPLKTVDAMIFARFSGGDPAHIRRSMRNKFTWLFIFSGSAALLYIILAPFLFKLLFPAYSEAVWYSQIYALWMMSVSFDPANVYLLAKKKIREQYAVNIGLSVFSIASVFIGAVYWGILGVIVARLSAKWVFALLSLVLYERAVHADNVRS